MTHSRLPPKIIRLMEEAVKAAKFETASFDGFREDKTVKLTFSDGSTKAYDSLTDLVRQVTGECFYSSSWIEGPLKQILEWSESVVDHDTDGYGLLERLACNYPHPDILDEAATKIKELESEVSRLAEFKRSVLSASETLKGREDV